MVQRSVDELVSKAHNESKVKSNKEFEDEPTVGSEIVQKTASEVASKKSVDTDIASDSEPKVAQSVPQDPWVDRIPDLLNSITKSSGLERKEVMRRAQRKRLALGPVTLWMTLLLVAREQRIELTDLMA